MATGYHGMRRAQHLELGSQLVAALSVAASAVARVSILLAKLKIIIATVATQQQGPKLIMIEKIYVHWFTSEYLHECFTETP